MCWCHMKNGEGELAVDQCSKALQNREEVEVLCDRAEAYLLNDLFAEGMHRYELIFLIHLVFILLRL